MSDVKFLADGMLGSLAKWLRLLGFDTLYIKDMEDDELARVAIEQGRVLLTRDVELAGRDGLASLLLAETDLDAQVRRVLEEYPVGPGMPMTRCSVCNGVLEDAEKGMVAGEVPEGVLERHDRFWRCPDCGRIYWKGTHWDDMRERLKAWRVG